MNADLLRSFPCFGRESCSCFELRLHLDHTPEHCVLVPGTQISGYRNSNYTLQANKELSTLTKMLHPNNLHLPRFCSHPPGHASERSPVVCPAGGGTNSLLWSSVCDVCWAHLCYQQLERPRKRLWMTFRKCWI